MSGLNYARRAITAAIETTYGVDSTPANSDGIIVYNFEITPLQGDVQDDEVLPNGLLGGAAKFLINKKVGLSFEIDLVGHATPGEAPPISPILRSVCFSETLTVGVDAVYTLVSEGEESCTIVWNLDGHEHRVTGFKGSMSWSITPDGKFRGKVSGEGIYNAPTKVAFPTVTFDNFQAALKTNPDTMQNISLLGWSGDVRSIEFDSGSDIQSDSLLTKRETSLAGRESSGSIVLENPDFDDKNFFDSIEADEVGAFSFDIDDGGAGRRCAISHPQVQLLEPKYGEVNNKATLEAGLNIFPDRDNQLSEVTLTFT